MQIHESDMLRIDNSILAQPSKKEWEAHSQEHLP